MPLNILGTIFVEGTAGIPGWEYIRAYAPPLVTLAGLKLFFGGQQNTWDRGLHGKVYLVTGATSGLGRPLVRELAAKGAQLVLLTSQSAEQNAWLVEFVEDLREKSGNDLIYSEQCDLSSLHSVRKFATKWLDNSPARRLDGVVCLAGESLPSHVERQFSVDGVERQMAINYLGHFHLLTLLSPALRVQPADRDVQVLLTTCHSQSMGAVDLGDLLWLQRKYPRRQPWKVFGTSKLMVSMFAKEFQKRLESVPRKDGEPSNVRVNVVNPGLMRSPSTRRVLSFGSIFGLLFYLLTYPVWFVFLKSCEQGMQSFVHVISNPAFVELRGGNFVANCRTYTPARAELQDEELMAKLYDQTESEIAELEKASAIERNRAKRGAKGDGGSAAAAAGKDKVPLFPEGAASGANSSGNTGTGNTGTSGTGNTGTSGTSSTSTTRSTTLKPSRRKNKKSKI